MSDTRPREGTVLNWRGPLLAAGIFASAFAILLLMARQNQSNTSDMGSSLRDDPYGASLLFDSYGHAGYQVKRSQDEDTLSDEDPLKTTAFFVGGHVFGWRMGTGNPGGEKFVKRIDDFLARGGRVIVVFPPRKLKSDSQGWEVENQWNETQHFSEPTWVSPDPRTMPEGSEKMYLTADAPWLKTDGAWTPLYSSAVDTKTDTDSDVRVYMAMRQVGKGQLIAASQESFLFNEAIKAHPNPALLDFLAGGRPVVWVDETLHGLHQDQGVLWLVQRYRLQVALLLFWAALLALLWSMSGDLVRRPARARDAAITRDGECAGVAGRRLLQRSIPPDKVVAECWEEFRRRSPQDAEAISADPRSGPRLRAALAESPLEGYKQLSQLVAERRASARSLARIGQDTPESSTFSPKKGHEEARFA